MLKSLYASTWTYSVQVSILWSEMLKSLYASTWTYSVQVSAYCLIRQNECTMSGHKKSMLKRWKNDFKHEREWFGTLRVHFKWNKESVPKKKAKSPIRQIFGTMSRHCPTVMKTLFGELDAITSLYLKFQVDRTMGSR